MIILAIAAPLLGAVADRNGWHKRLMISFWLTGCTATALLVTTGGNDYWPTILLFIVGNLALPELTYFIMPTSPFLPRLISQTGSRHGDFPTVILVVAYSWHWYFFSSLSLTILASLTAALLPVLVFYSPLSGGSFLHSQPSSTCQKLKNRLRFLIISACRVILTSLNN